MLSKLKSLWEDERVQFAAYVVAYFAIISLVPKAMSLGGAIMWLMWPLVLLAQNFAFTFVSRARSSASLLRHAKASLMSNGIWIVSQGILLGPMIEYITGKHGVGKMVFAELMYTTSTMAGSLYAHWHALRTEKGKDAVGANKRYAQIPNEEWARVKQIIQALADTTPPKEEATTASQTLESGTFRVEYINDGSRVFQANFTSKEAAERVLDHAFGNSQENIRIVPN
jgi:hypothetical protein